MAKFMLSNLLSRLKWYIPDLDLTGEQTANNEQFKKDQLAHVRSERDILAESDSPWVVKLHTTFQDTTFLYMLMEFLPGGDLMTMLIKYEIFTEDITRFYMAEITLALEAVHKLGFIHR
jgi:protein-serine/threonine kinase